MEHRSNRAQKIIIITRQSSVKTPFEWKKAEARATLERRYRLLIGDGRLDDLTCDDGGWWHGGRRPKRTSAGRAIAELGKPLASFASIAADRSPCLPTSNQCAGR